MLGEIYSEDGRPVMAALAVDRNNKFIDIEGYNVISSAYARGKNYESGIRNYQNLINTSVIRYIEPNKKEPIYGVHHSGYNCRQLTPHTVL